MTKTTTILAVLLSGAVVAGCQTARNSFSSVDNEGKREFLRYAAGESPLFVTAKSAPFPGGDAAAASKIAAELSTSPYFGGFDFTDDESAAKQSHFRIVVAFDTPAALDPTAICIAGDAPVAAAPKAGELTMHMAFCAREETLSAAIVSGPAAQGLDDPRFADAVHQAYFELFPRERERDRDRGDGVLTF